MDAAIDERVASRGWKTIFVGEGYYHAMAIRRQSEQKQWWKYQRVLTDEENLIIKEMRGMPKWLKKKLGIDL